MNIALILFWGGRKGRRWGEVWERSREGPEFRKRQGKIEGGEWEERNCMKSDRASRVMEEKGGLMGRKGKRR